MKTNRRNMLHSWVRFALFATSYCPLFLLMILKIYFKYPEYLHFGGFNNKAILTFLKYFGLSSLLISLIIIGFIGILFFLKQIDVSVATNGSPIVIKDVKNKNNEAISYIGTYIIPFLFQDYTGWYEIISIFILLIVIYFIYINSTLILINPLLNLKYSIYEVEFFDDHIVDLNRRVKSALIITKERYLEDEDKMLFKKIGHKLFYGINRAGGGHQDAISSKCFRQG